MPLSAGVGEALAHASATEIDASTGAASTASGQLSAAPAMTSDTPAGAESMEAEASTGLPHAPSGNLRALPLAGTGAVPSATLAEIAAGTGLAHPPSDRARAVPLADTSSQRAAPAEIKTGIGLARSPSGQSRAVPLAGTAALPSVALVVVEGGTGLAHFPSGHLRALPVAGTNALPTTPSVEIEPGTGRASAPSGRLPVPRPRPDSLTFDAPGLCALIEEAAERHDIPPEFFARLIWQESRFDIAALSPVGAEGVAQFMPGTAALRGLSNSWDPRVAIPESARFLADLRDQFGNLGLAAAAYNGGPDRVARWLGNGGRLPYETVNYVISITSRPVEWFREPGREVEAKPLEEGVEFAEACGRMPVIATRAMGVGQRKPWGVQIAAGISQGAAIRAFHRARGRLSSIIGGAEPVLVRSKLVAGRTAWSARVGADSRGEALALCQRIRSAGTACVVRQN